MSVSFSIVVQNVPDDAPLEKPLFAHYEIVVEKLKEMKVIVTDSITSSYCLYLVYIKSLYSLTEKYAATRFFIRKACNVHCTYTRHQLGFVFGSC